MFLTRSLVTTPGSVAFYMNQPRQGSGMKRQENAPSFLRLMVCAEDVLRLSRKTISEREPLRRMCATLHGPPLAITANCCL